MISSIADILAPHYCCGCGIVGGILCESCKYDIVYENASHCVVCGKQTTGQCRMCNLPYVFSTFVGERSGVIEKLVNASKFDSCRQGCIVQARLLTEVVPRFPAKAVIVPLPTIPAHIRQRGYDHTLVMAREIGRMRKAPVLQVLLRANQDIQHGASRKQRFEQAKRAFSIHVALDTHTTYVLVDDVVTTGASVRYAAEALLQAGAGAVWVAATSRQPIVPKLAKSK